MLFFGFVKLLGQGFSISLMVLRFALPVLILKIVLISNTKNNITEMTKNKIVKARQT